ncbi:hypothetical protein CASFOL_009556 [Castilleja foliolosa]|uniref:H(+)-transporting two-sector ATPase n=1 Tax=Castilleja foliolosa TaxID=1961234 RepID=A0ABD3DXE4_9LAMI
MDPLEVGSSQTNLGSELPWLIRYQMPFRLLQLILLLLVLGFPRLKKKPGAYRIVQIIGPVLDVAFPPGKMPNIYNALVVKGRDTVGQAINVTCEVQQLLGNNRVRAVAMSATDGLMRGMEVVVKLLWINR